MAKRSPVATVFTVMMDVLVVIAIADTLRLIVRFFGELASQSWAQTLVAATNAVVVPVGLDAIKTPYGGIFEVNAAITVVAVLVIEWVLSIVRSRV